MSKNSFQTRSTFQANGKTYDFFSLPKLNQHHNIDKLPFCLKILTENLLRCEDGVSVTQKDIEALINWSPKKPSDQEIAFTPGRVILQDFTGVPAVVDLAAMREAMLSLGGKPKQINLLSPVELVIDHSVMVDYYKPNDSFELNVEKEYERNQERYAFLRWGQTAFNNFRVVPPGTGIVHQVNLEYLGRVALTQTLNNKEIAYFDTLVGTDSHTTMINGLGILGWGVGGIEAEAAMLGQPITMLIPEVVGFRLTGQLKSITTATDLVLRVTELLRKKNVVGKFVEFFGDGLDHLPLADRATIANMAPEYGATCGLFPIDKETITFLKLSGRDKAHIELVEQFAKAQGLFRETGAKEAEYSEVLELDLSSVEPAIAGPRRPQDRISLTVSKTSFDTLLSEQKIADSASIIKLNGQTCRLTHGTVVIAAITSCTNTSNPDVMIAAGLLCKKAQEKGLTTKPWVKTSLAPGSQVVTDYLEKANLLKPLDDLGFKLIAYGCTTCIGNSGPLLPEISEGIKAGKLSVAAVLSGNRNFEGRIHPEVRFSYLASPPLVVAYALAGTMNIDLEHEALGTNKEGTPIFLKDIWPSREEIKTYVQNCVQGEMYQKRYHSVFDGDKLWKALDIPKGELYQWNNDSTYVKLPPFFEGMTIQKPAKNNIENARVLVLLGDSVTTDHISPAGDIAKSSPAGIYLQSQGVPPEDFNSYGSRRGNHEIMMRGTFGNIRLKNYLVPEVEGPVTLYLPTGEQMSIYDAAMQYQKEGIALIAITGKEYGTGSSRDWAAKGVRLLGVKAVIAESFERIHRSNLIGMGVLPLQFLPSENRETFGLTGHEVFNLSLDNIKPRGTLKVQFARNGVQESFNTIIRIDTPKEMEYFQNDGILHYVLRNMVSNTQSMGTQTETAL